MILYASIIMTGLEVVPTRLTTFMIMCILVLNSPNMLMYLNYLMSIHYIQYVIFKIYKKVTYLALTNTHPGCHQYSLSIQCCFFVLSSRNPHFLFGNICTSVSRSFSSCKVVSTHLLHTGDISGRVIGSHVMVSWLHPGITVVVDCSEVEGTMLALVCVAGTTFQV